MVSISDGTTTVLGESPQVLAELVAGDDDFDFCALSGEQLTEMYSAGAWWEQGHRPGVTRLHALLKDHSIPYVVYYVDNRFGDPSTCVSFGSKRGLPIQDITKSMIFDALVTNARMSGAPVPASVPPMFMEMRDARTLEYLNDWQRVVQALVNVGQHNRKVTLLRRLTTPGRWNFWDQVHAITRDPLSVGVLVEAGFSRIPDLVGSPLHPMDMESARRTSSQHDLSFRDLREWLRLFPAKHYDAVEVSGVLLAGPPVQVAELAALIRGMR